MSAHAGRGGRLELGGVCRSLAPRPSDPLFNPNFRQLLHVAYKVAAKMGKRYTDMLVAAEPSIARNVTENLFERHIRPVF